jgi:hypothetical protein
MPAVRPDMVSSFSRDSKDLSPSNEGIASFAAAVTPLLARCSKDRAGLAD